MANGSGAPLNGKQFRLGAFSQGLSVLLIGALLIWTASIGMDMRDFMTAGDRCTAVDCLTMASNIDIHLSQTEQYRGYLDEKLEDILVGQHRLQRQIDRLEGVVFKGSQKPTLPPYGYD